MFLDYPALPSQLYQWLLSLRWFPTHLVIHFFGHAAVVPPNCCTVTAANLLAPQLNMGDVHVCVCVCLQKEVFSSALKGIER